LFGKFTCRLEAQGAAPNKSEGFRVAGTFHNDLHQYLREQALKVITDAAADAVRQINEAQQKVRDARASLDQLDAQIRARRSEIESKRAQAAAKLAQAQRDLASAQSSVDRLGTTIRDKERLRDELARRQVCTTFRVWVPTPTWRNPFAGHYEDRTVCVPDAQALVQAAALDVEIAGLYVALGTAKAALAAAQTAVQLAQRAIDTTPIELDAVLVGLYAARATADGALKVADAVLQKIKEALGRVAAISDFVAQHGSGALVEVRGAKFSASLSAAAGGSISLELDVAYLGKLATLQLDFNFNDPLASAQALGRALLSRT
jgi:hypothetical protein